MLTYARSGLSGVIGIRASGFFHSSQFQAPGGALEDLLSPRWRVPAPAHHVAARSFRWPGPGGRGSPHTFSHAAFDPEGSLPWGALPVPRLPPPQKPRLARVAPSWSHAASPPPAGRQPPQMPSHRIGGKEMSFRVFKNPFHCTYLITFSIFPLLQKHVFITL